jgi:2-phospho-L-lactate transferase/gluconeogenesis factor (CofD/UPF0052 family)
MAKPGKNPAPAATEPKAKTRRIKVRATSKGYYDHAIRREGDVFVVDEKDLSQKWMEKVDVDTPEKVSGAQEAINLANGELKAGRRSPADTSDEI